MFVIIRSLSSAVIVFPQTEPELNQLFWFTDKGQYDITSQENIHTVKEHNIKNDYADGTQPCQESISSLLLVPG